MYQSYFCWHTPQPRGRLTLKPWTGGVSSLSNPGLALFALSWTLNWQCLLFLEHWTSGVSLISNPELAVSTLSWMLDWQCWLNLVPWTGSFRSLSDAGLAVSAQSRTLIASSGARLPCSLSRCTLLSSSPRIWYQVILLYTVQSRWGTYHGYCCRRDGAWT